MLRSAELFLASDNYPVSACTAYLCSASRQKSRKVGYLRLFRRTSTTVTPFAVTAASIIFSVAPTDGNESDISVPLSPLGAEQSRKPCVSSITAPILRSADRCRSIGLGPSSHPPGYDILQCPVLPSTDPRKTIEERISRISLTGISQLPIAQASDITVLPLRLHFTPICESIRSAASTSVSLGQLCITLSPSFARRGYLRCPWRS